MNSLECTQLVARWADLGWGDRWVCGYNNVIYTAAKNRARQRGYNSNLNQAMNIMHYTLKACFNNVERISPPCKLQLESLKEKVSERYDNYLYHRGLLGRIWDAFTSIFLTKMSIEYTYFTLMEELIRLSNLDLASTQEYMEAARNRNAEPEPANEPIAEPEQICLPTATPEETEQAGVTYATAHSCSDIHDQATLDLVRIRSDLQPWEQFLLNKDLPHQQKIYLQVTRNPKGILHQAWTPEILKEIKEKKNVGYYLLALPKSQGSEPSLWDSTCLCQGLAAYQAHHNLLGNNRVFQTDFSEVLVQHACTANASSPTSHEDEFYRYLHDFIRRCLNQGKQVCLMADEREIPAAHLQALRQYENRTCCQLKMRS